MDWHNMEHATEAIAEFRNRNPDAISHIKRFRSDEEQTTPISSIPFISSIITHMSQHGENTVHKEGKTIEEGQNKQVVPLPIPPCVTPPVPVIPLFSISEQIEGEGPRQEAIMAALMQICNTTFDHTFAENATDIDRVMVLGCQPMAKASPGEGNTDSIILELSHIWPPGTRPPSICHATDTSVTTTTATTTVHEDEWSSKSMAPQSDMSQHVKAQWSLSMLDVSSPGGSVCASCYSTTCKTPRWSPTLR